VPVIPYDGYNFMPTPQGYSSFFGTNSLLGINALTGNVDEVFTVQRFTLENTLVALKDDGIWSKALNSSGAWTQNVVLSVPASGVHKNWSKCIIDQHLYVYRQGEAGHWKWGPGTSYVFTQVVPTFLNMAGQLGIFKAGSRLGYWDSENSVSWSELIDTGVFTPSIERLAGNTIFQDIVGRIVVVLQHGTGFVIYATRSIVHVTRQEGNPMLFKGRSIFNNNGISYRKEAVMLDPDTKHMAMTTTGLVEISEGAAQFSAPEASTYFKEKRQPFYLDLVNGRYLFLSFLDDYYLQGRISFNEEAFAGVVYTFEGASLAIEGWDSGDLSGGPCRALLAAMVSHESRYLFDTYGYESSVEAAGTGQVPIWQDNINSVIPIADLAAFKVYADAGDPEGYFTSVAFSNAGITKISSGTEYYVPNKIPDLVSAFATHTSTEANTDNFFLKQDTVFDYEAKFFDAWLKAILNKVHSTVTVVGSATYSSVAPSGGAPTTPVYTTYTAGPYIDLSPSSESNKYYGIETKSAWLQRSLTRGISFKFRDKQYSQSTGSELPWRQTAVPQAFWFVQPPEYATYAALMAAIGGGATAIMSWISQELVYGGTWGGSPNPGVFNSYVERDQASDAQARKVTITMTYPAPVGMVTVTYFAWDGTTLGDSINTIKGNAVYKSATTSYQEFLAPVIEYTPYATCTYKELGYTSIIGHGHYESNGSFVQDDSTSEAPDYIDACLASPLPSFRPLFNGFPIDNPSSGGYICGYGTGSVIVAGATYTYPTYTVTIPGGTNLLQQGSIEPIYPTFLGAFVFDLHYKKWGKLRESFKNLLDIFPVNTMAGEGVFPYDSFLPKMGCRLTTGTFPIFDQYPANSQIVYGKIGFYRKGFTDLEEIHIQHRMPMTGSVGVELSMDGSEIATPLTQLRTYENTRQSVEGFGASARWYNVIIEGFFDLIGLEFRGHRSGRR
jgi:hypothetical protein